MFRWMHRAVSTDYSRLKDRDRFGGTLLHYTAWFNRIDGAKSLLQAGVGRTMLHCTGTPIAPKDTMMDTHASEHKFKAVI